MEVTTTTNLPEEPTHPPVTLALPGLTNLMKGPKSRGCAPSVFFPSALKMITIGPVIAAPPLLISPLEAHYRHFGLAKVLTNIPDTQNLIRPLQPSAPAPPPRTPPPLLPRNLLRVTADVPAKLSAKLPTAKSPHSTPTAQSHRLPRQCRSQKMRFRYPSHRRTTSPSHSSRRRVSRLRLANSSSSTSTERS